MNSPSPIEKISILLLVLGVGLAACTDQRADPSDSVNIAINGTPITAGPGFSSSKYSSALVLATYQTLFEYRYLSRPLELIPSLAADWPEVSDDGKTVLIRIVDNARFSDDPVFDMGVGRPVTAQDVAYSLLRHFDQSSNALGQDVWRDILVGVKQWDGDYDRPPPGIRVIDELTIEFRLNTASPVFLHKLATSFAAIVPREAEQAYGLELARHSVGSGPYVLESFDSEKALLSANKNYQPRRFDLAQAGFDSLLHTKDYLDLQGQSLPLTRQIVVHFVGSMSSRWMAFDNSELDIIPVNERFLTGLLEEQDPPKLKSGLADRFRWQTGDHNEISFMRVRMDDAFLGSHEDPKINERNARLRCAIREAIDPYERNDQFFEGRGIPLWGVIAPSLPEFSFSTYGSPPKSAVGANLFQHIGPIESLPEISFGFKSGVNNEQNFALFQSQLTRAGYPAELIKPAAYATFDEYLNATYEGKHQISLVGWSLSYPDVEDNLKLFYGPNKAPGANMANYQNHRYDELYQQVNRMTPSPERTELVAEMNELLWKDCSYLSSLGLRNNLLVQRRVVGLPDHSAPMIGRYFQFLKVQ